MKLIGLLVFILLFPLQYAESPLPLDEAGKVSFKERVEIEGSDRDMLMRNAMAYVTQVKQVGVRSSQVQASHSQSRVSKVGSFLVYKKGMFTPQVHGEISFRLNIDVEEEGFTYHYTDFVFQYYAKNRYGVFAPVNGKKKPLEQEKFAGMQELWQQHKQTTRRHIENHIKALKASMRQIPPGAGLYDEEHYKELN